MKFLAIVKSFALRSLTGRILTAIELFVGLLILFYTFDRFAAFDQISRYSELYSGIAAYETSDEGAESYVRSHGTPLGAACTLQLQDKNGNNLTGISAFLAEKTLFQNTPLELCDGEWFAENDEARIVAVVPYSLRNTYPCRSIQTIDFVDYGRKNVYISGVLNSDVTFANSDRISFDDANRTMLLTDPDHTIEYDPVIGLYSYALLESADTSELKASNIVTVGMMAEAQKSERDHTLAPLWFFTAALFVLFTCGYLGEQFLSLSERTKTFAVFYMCGAGRRTCFFAQLAADLFWLIVPFVLALAAATALGIRLRPIGLLIPFVYLFAGSCLLSLSLLHYINKQSPVQMIKRRFYS